MSETPDGARIPPLYGFIDHLSAAFPCQILVDVTEVCNLACIHCPHEDFRRSQHYGARMLKSELNTKLVTEVARHGQGHTLYMRYASNGEPLIHREILAMLEDACTRSGVAVTLTTNGMLMDRAVSERLVDMGLAFVDVSIDALHPQTYAAIRRKGDLARVRENLLALMEISAKKGGKTKAVASFIEQEANRAEAEAFERFWREAGAAFVVVRRMHSCSGAKAELAAARRQLTQSLPRRPCLYPWERIGLNAAGKLAYCPSDWCHGSVIADYETTTVLETWQGAFLTRLRRAHLENDLAEFPFCGQCPDWEATRWPHEGRSYADMVHDFQTESAENG